MASVVERATWAEHSSLHAVLSVAALPVCFGIVVFLSRFQGAQVTLAYRLTRQTVWLFTLILLGASLGVAIVNNNTHFMPHFKSVHSILGIVDVALMVVRMMIQVVLNFMVRRGRAISQTLFDAMHSFLRYAMISVTLATILTGILVRFVALRFFYLTAAIEPLCCSQRRDNGLHNPGSDVGWLFCHLPHLGNGLFLFSPSSSARGVVVVRLCRPQQIRDGER